MTSTNKSLKKFLPQFFTLGFCWKFYRTIGSHVSCAFIEIWSTWEVWRALKKLEFLLAMPQATLTHLLCSVVKKWEAIYPLHPNINAYILHTFLFNSPWYQHGEFGFYNWEILKLVIMSLILVPFAIDLRMILYGEFRRLSLIGVLGLIDMSLEFDQKVNKDAKL